MKQERIAAMADRVAKSVKAGPDNDEAFVNVDGALDAMIAAVQAINENLPHVKTSNVPQKAAVDAVKDLMETAIEPYLADIVQAMEVFGG
jgi:predicted RNase H-like HicB family nuclease